MRVAVWNNLPSGGGKRALYDHVAGLVYRGHHVESWCPPIADQDFLSLGDLVDEHVVEFPLEDSTLWHVLSRITDSASGVWQLLKALDDHCRRCAIDIGRGGFDVLLLGGSFYFAMSPMARYSSIPTIAYLQEPNRMLYEAPTPWPATQSARPSTSRLVSRSFEALRLRMMRLAAREELMSAQACDRILVNSYYSRESVARAYGLDSNVCYLGVDSAKFRPLGLTKEGAVIGIGEFARRKQIDVAIRTVAEVSPRPSLWWVGNVADEAYLAELRGLAHDQGVDFHPFVSVAQSSVVELLNRASLLLYAPRLEPFGYAPLEAGACGLPTVALASGGVRETVRHQETGLLVDQTDQLPAAVQRLLDEPDLRDRMGRAALSDARSRWTIGAATERLESELIAVRAGTHVERCR